MITVKMTEAEYKAYLLYMKSVEVIQEAGINAADCATMKEFRASSQQYKELETAINEVNEGKVTYIDPDHLWESML